MPWAPINLTPIQLGILKAAATRAGFSCATRPYFIDALSWFCDQTRELPPEERLTVTDYTRIAVNHWRKGLGDWVFAVPPYRENTPEADEAYFSFLIQREVPESAIRKAALMRSLVPALLERLVEDLLSLCPRAVGFSSVFAQNISSLVLARMVKEKSPDVRIIFGGSNCDGPMGEVIARSFPWVDIVVRGEAELVLPEVLQDVRDERPTRRQPGLCFRENDEVVIVSSANAATVEMDAIPTPDYDEYFSRLNKSSIRGKVAHEVRVLFESARGCWWGEKQHCTFCGLNGATMKFRSKSPDRAASEILGLSKRYYQTKFEAVDNIIDTDYLTSLLPILRKYRRSGFDVTVFYETKSSLRKKNLREMSEAGIRSIQPGIESLSTPILRLMRKGVTGWQNIALLKWARQYGITVYWNILYGFPGEPLAEYVRMAEVLKSITHLEPPSLAQIVVERFSPYQQTPAAFGLTNVKPAAWYEFVYDLSSDDLTNLAYDFDHSFADDYDPSAVKEILAPIVEEWEEAYKVRKPSLTYRRGPGFMIITDRRSTRGGRQLIFDELQARVYLACDAGNTAEAIAKRLNLSRPDNKLSVEKVQEILDTQVKARLHYVENGRYLSLAIPEGDDCAEIDAEQDSERLPSIAPVELIKRSEGLNKGN
jgi:ribosomal peptide maturation radical SAM protein 1